jgi:hypothetical protein
MDQVSVTASSVVDMNWGVSFHETEFLRMISLTTCTWKLFGSEDPQCSVYDVIYF